MYEVVKLAKGKGVKKVWKQTAQGFRNLYLKIPSSDTKLVCALQAGVRAQCIEESLWDWEWPREEPSRAGGADPRGSSFVDPKPGTAEVMLRKKKKKKLKNEKKKKKKKLNKKKKKKKFTTKKKKKKTRTQKKKKKK
ncbi:PREDICTED: nucleolar protein 58-like [Cercocebus atys]|uniref:nucleolar protein 58-like n=1 Tax=Cercocebus atys TaxID=9531 RepID=UPI0005F445E9|nr:PREDICTED: nucleolar protein 58-like [Cercocebus atys]